MKNEIILEDDFLIELSEENAEKMVKVIREFGIESLGLSKEDFLKK